MPHIGVQTQIFTGSLRGTRTYVVDGQYNIHHATSSNAVTLRGYVELRYLHCLYIGEHLFVLQCGQGPFIG